MFREILKWLFRDHPTRDVYSYIHTAHSAHYTVQNHEHIVITSIVDQDLDQDPYWIRIQELCGSVKPSLKWRVVVKGTQKCPLAIKEIPVKIRGFLTSLHCPKSNPNFRDIT